VADVAGILYIVATPIGNLEDITYRALRVLREVDLIACEDTRHTRRLLDYYGVDKPAISYHEHNEITRSEEFISRLREGQSIALVSDAGTPLISDPGYRVVAKAAEAGISVVPVPGPSAIIAALAASGLPTDRFYFGGFLPAKASQRRKALLAIAGLDCTVAFYEAPHRILEAMEDIEAALPGRQVVVARELTKMHEEFLRGSVVQVLAALRERQAVKGEITVLIGRGVGEVHNSRPAGELLDEYMAKGLSRMDAIKAVARDRGVSKREVYAELELYRRPGAG
jgi:16S rRNA (cytidine1402-2'-O)-methyltransferase